MGFSKIFVLGAGAIGSVYGALLSKRNSVTLIGNKMHVEAIKLNGLSIIGDENQVFHPEADTEIREVPDKTLILLCTKAYDTEKAIQGIARLVKGDTVILVLQNGLGNEEIVKSLVSKKCEVLRGLTTMSAEFFTPGEIRFWKGETVIAKNSVSEEISRLLNECGIACRLSSNINQEIWNKLVVNCVVNPLTAIFQVRDKDIVRLSLASVRREIIKECTRVGEAEGITLGARSTTNMDESISSYSNFSSMCQDLMKGNRTEISFLNGKIVELGRKHKIPTPVNETLVSFIKYLEEKIELSRKD